MTKCKNPLAIKVYSTKEINGRDDNFIFISFDSVKDYVNYTYNEISKATTYIEKKIELVTSEFKEYKIDRNKDSLTILNEIKSVFQIRKWAYAIDEVIDYLSCETSEKSNENSVKLYREFLVSKIPSLCTAVDNIDHDTLVEIFEEMLPIPSRTYESFSFQFEKIFTYLNVRSKIIDPQSDEAWGLDLVDKFSKEFAQKWVIINTEKMEYIEIKLLFYVACYLEWKDQNDMR